MKKLIALLFIAGMMTFGIGNVVFAQAAETATTETVDTAKPKTFHEAMKERFIEGGPVWMAPILLTLIFGLAIAVERILYLTLSGTNTTKLLTGVENALASGGVEEAKNICRNTRGPVASIFYQGLMRYDSGIEEVEKSVVSYGSVITGRMESGISWISLFIALAPMLGFLGTVIGMIQAFDDIAAAGDISPQIVANGIKIALLTTVFGLIVAIILQILYNYIISKVDSLINSMEDTSISFMDILNKYNKK
ncbi:MAG: MotA/TolQ/ExbB proton channel family protein [Bacteroidetes bacterium]|nr:MotA/TolQ/ExbB proton channel family protein [Bacteroidales bacterium]MBU1008716.1 MotA/TolQ/ExbB proton channel family protein [Bacteroidota bacterium]